MRNFYREFKKELYLVTRYKRIYLSFLLVIIISVLAVFFIISMLDTMINTNNNLTEEHLLYLKNENYLFFVFQLYDSLVLPIIASLLSSTIFYIDIKNDALRHKNIKYNIRLYVISKITIILIGAVICSILLIVSSLVLKNLLLDVEKYNIGNIDISSVEIKTILLFIELNIILFIIIALCTSILTKFLKIQSFGYLINVFYFIVFPMVSSDKVNKYHFKNLFKSIVNKYAQSDKTYMLMTKMNQIEYLNSGLSISVIMFFSLIFLIILVGGIYWQERY